MRKNTFPFLLASLFISASTLQGCSNYITPDDFLTHLVRNPAYLQPYQAADWFNTSKHTLSEIRFKHDDGQVTRGVELKVDGALNTVLYFGGHPFTQRVDEVATARQFALMGVNFISVHSRGIDSNGNWPTVSRLKKDTIEVYEQVKAGYPNDFIILHGLALSTFFVAELTEMREVDAIVLESVLTRIDESVEARIPWLLRLPVYTEVDNQLAGMNNYSSLKTYRGPLLLLAGEKDFQYPAQLARAIYQASPSVNKSISVIEGASQGEIINQDQSLEAYLMFINQNGIKQ
ncbi:alpha/beta hydrolase [Photobacterium sp. J15]|uniref:alpha/beta hydrolase n=1 Tax=Photobacterium sp. J15 TaxID=265901 RepID=UPI0007E4848D|nr:alpha/beta hydrolase [Photobacterium sp. J15]